MVNPFEVRLVMSDVNNPGHTMLPIGQSETDNSDRQMLMPDLVGYEHQGTDSYDFKIKTSTWLWLK